MPRFNASNTTQQSKNCRHSVEQVESLLQSSLKTSSLREISSDPGTKRPKKRKMWFHKQSPKQSKLYRLKQERRAASKLKAKWSRLSLNTHVDKVRRWSDVSKDSELDCLSPLRWISNITWSIGSVDVMLSIDEGQIERAIDGFTLEQVHVHVEPIAWKFI